MKIPKYFTSLAIPAQSQDEMVEEKELNEQIFFKFKKTHLKYLTW